MQIIPKNSVFFLCIILISSCTNNNKREIAVIDDLNIGLIKADSIIEFQNEKTYRQFPSDLNFEYDKNDIAACTALAGEMLGLKLIYMDTGSGANKHVSLSMVQEVRKNISIPIIVGGGIRKPEDAYEICKAGADIIVIGTIAEESPGLIEDIARSVHYNQAFTQPAK